MKFKFSAYLTEWKEGVIEADSYEEARKKFHRKHFKGKTVERFTIKKSNEEV